jgi:23S rRNA (adenine-N6)-dimethyltransferase
MSSPLLSPCLSITQCFLKNQKLVARLIKHCSIDQGDMVYEIGPGKGIITAQLAQRCKQVVAIEKDPSLAACLLKQFSECPNVSIIAGDFLDYPLPASPYKIFANIPFNITTAIVSKITAAANPPGMAALVMQKEAARMYLGKPKESLRAVLLKPWFEFDLMYYFNRCDFIPTPGVDVVLLRISKRSPPLISAVDRQPFRDFVVYCFSQWQPDLACTLKKVLSGRQVNAIEKRLGQDLNVSPTALPFEDWLHLFASFKTVGTAQTWSVLFGSEKRLVRQQNKLQKMHRSRTTRRQRGT